MLNREIYLNSIIESLSLLKNEVSLQNAINLYDINIVAEDFYAGLLNLICDYKLTNINNIIKNAQGIDLVDAENRVTIQVTSDNSSGKIKHTIDEFIDNNSHKIYDKLIILILTQKKNYTTDFDTQGLFTFDKSQDIWDVEDLIKKIKKMDINKIKSIKDFLELEFSSKCYSAKSSQASEVDTIIDLIEYISGHREVKKPRNVIIDPEYKIYKRFKDFSEGLVSQYTSLFTVYGTAMETVKETLGIDEAQEIVTMIYLQDISVKYLDESNSNPIDALNKLVDFFEEKLSANGKKYDKSAIKFYLVSELIKCSVFPNERSEYNGSK